ncbi:hypothetical protein PG995_014557 [Apiospora arundinis]
MEAALSQIRELAAQGEDSRWNVMVALRDLACSLEEPNDTIHRFGQMHLQAAIVQVGIDLGVFKCLTESVVPMAVDEVSEKTGSEPELTIRLLRFLVAIGAVSEDAGTDKARYTANHVTHNLTEKVVEAGLSHYFATAGPQYQSLPQFLRQTEYKNPVDDTRTAFRMAFDTDLDSFSWFSHNPSHLAHFNSYMALRRKPSATWLSVYPVVAEAGVNWPADKPLYVNIGGGVGHQCAQFREKYPDFLLPGRVVLQDLPHSVAEALPTPGVENMAHDIFEPQPIVGAKFYHLRAVLHNHPPHKVRRLLETIKAVMTHESIMIIDEMVLPEVGVTFNAAAIDMTMLAAFASMERTEAQWRETFEGVGLKLVRTYTYNPLSYESAMEVRLP